MAFVTDQKAHEYLECFPPRPRANLREKYPAVGEECIDLLEKVLVFNPYFRPSVQECLEHPYFKNIRNFEKEKPADEEI